jgi:hypothetical protein
MNQNGGINLNLYKITKSKYLQRQQVKGLLTYKKEKLKHGYTYTKIMSERNTKNDIDRNVKIQWVLSHFKSGM